MKLWLVQNVDLLCWPADKFHMNVIHKRQIIRNNPILNQPQDHYKK